MRLGSTSDGRDCILGKKKHRRAEVPTISLGLKDGAKEVDLPNPHAGRLLASLKRYRSFVHPPVRAIPDL